MRILYLLAIILIGIGIFVLFDLTPERISNDLLQFLHRPKSLKYRIAVQQGKVKKSKLQTAFNDIEHALEETHSENKFAILCTFSIIGLVGGCLLAVLIDNVIFIPVFALIFAAAPFIYVKSLTTTYNKHIAAELETALSIVTTAYMSNEDIIFAIEQSIPHINQPVKNVFKKFLGQTKLINSNVTLAISNMKNDINNEIFHEWCDNLIQCQENITLKATLQPITARLADIRIVNAELETMLMNPRREFVMMLFITIANIPLLYFLNTEWFSVLVDTFVGRLVLSLIGVVCVITTILMFKYTQPIEYRR